MTLTDCQRCPRLARHLCEIREAFPDYHARPVGSWGAARPRILIVGLAPGLHGAAKTGKAFVGDASGSFLFQALHRAELATSAQPDCARLNFVRITNAVKCLPPGNLPSSGELSRCRSYLVDEFEQYLPEPGRRPRVVLALGTVAYAACCAAAGNKVGSFAHGAVTHLSGRRALVTSYHPSRLNVNTKRLTEAMMDEVLQTAKSLAAMPV